MRRNFAIKPHDGKTNAARCALRLAQELQDVHIVLAERFTGLAGPDNVAYETRPVVGPLLLEDMH